MKKIAAKTWRGWLLAGCLVCACGCQTVRRDTVTQISTIDALLAGAYDGQMLCSQLGSLGNLGIGTFEGLDGEMIVLDREVYQAKADGRIYRPPVNTKTPFASMVEFRGDQALAVRDGTDFPGFQRLIDAVSPNTNLLCAVRFEGRFRHMRVRSVPGQSKPYPPLVEVTRHQPMFEHNDVEGTLVGFRLPSYVKGINVPGYHVHFISKDRQVGGHVLAFLVAGGTVILDTCHRFVMILPRDGSGFNRVDFNQDRSKELEKAEK